MYSSSELLSRAFQIKSDSVPDCNEICSLCGNKKPSVRLNHIIKPATSEIADTFKHSQFVCLECAACFAENRLLTGNIYADEFGTGLKPMIARSSATKERPAWCDLIESLPVGIETVAIFTSNAKRRLWTNAVVSHVGSSWRVLFVDGDVDRILMIDCTKLTAVMRQITFLMRRGYSKRAIAENLLSATKPSGITRLIFSLESEMKQVRHTDEFLLALFIAQE